MKLATKIRTGFPVRISYIIPSLLPLHPAISAPLLCCTDYSWCWLILYPVLRDHLGNAVHGVNVCLCLFLGHTNCLGNFLCSFLSLLHIAGLRPCALGEQDRRSYRLCFLIHRNIQSFSSFILDSTICLLYFILRGTIIDVWSSQPCGADISISCLF